MADPGTLEQLAVGVGQALSALQDVLTPANAQVLFAELGMDAPPDLAGDATFTQKLTDAAQKAGELSPEIDAALAAADAGDDQGLIAAVGHLLTTVGGLLAALDAVATDLQRAASTTAGIESFAAAFVENILGTVAVAYLDNTHPFLRRVTSLLTLTESTPVTLLIDGEAIEVERRILHFDRIAGLFKDPMAVLRDAYGWGADTFDGQLLFANARAVFDTTVLPATAAGADSDGPANLDLFGAVLHAATDASPPGLELGLFVDAPENLDLTLAQLSDEWRLALQLQAGAAAGARVRLLPPARLQLLPPQGTAEGNVAVVLQGAASDPATPFVILGESGGSRLEALAVLISASADFTWDAVANRAAADAGFEVKVTQANLLVDTSGSDGLLEKLLPPPGLNAGFSFDLGWTAARGFFFSGSASLEHAFALNLTAGPFHVDTLHLVIASESGELQLEASIDGGGTLGPVAVSVERIGIDLDLKFARGNLGLVDLAAGFKFPTGLGLSIDAGPITGGGFIEYDPANGRYSNVLSLSCYGITVNAIALLDTRLPGGESGFSFLILISGQFTPIQLSFGFTLNGVGGLCGINRDFVSSALQAGLRAHTLDHILFPQDPIANAPAIISDLRSIFPPVEGRYVFGPMAELGWGGGLNLVTAELGILLTLPSPVVIVILGQFNVVLPNADAPLVELHLDVLGTIDFGKKLFSLDATLHDSRIVEYTVFGDMAMRLGWGDNPSFALSIGGLNPHFQPPDNFPQLKRLTLSLSDSQSLKLSIQSYFAITSNTFQIGAKCELQAGSGSYNVYGWLDFDALFIFTPFSFTVDFTAGLALRSGTSTLFGISLDGELSGTSPWQVHGDAHISLLFFDLSVSVDYTWGDATQITAPPVDAWPQLRAALQDVQNWSGSLPASVPAPVTMSTPDATPAQIFVDPSGVLSLRERVLPLNQTLSKFGEAIPGPQTAFTLDQVQLGGQPLPFSLITDKFAPAQFEQLPDQDKLSRPSFDDGVAGFSVGDGQLAFGQQFGLDLAYVDIYVDDHAAPPRRQIFQPTLLQQVHWARSNQASKSGLTTALGKFAPSGAQLVTLASEQFVVATVDELTQRADITAPVSKGEAYRALQAHLANNPDEQGQLQVLPLYELAA